MILDSNWGVELEPISLHGVIKFNSGAYGRLLSEKVFYKKSKESDKLYEFESLLEMYVKKDIDLKRIKDFDLNVKYGPLRYRSNTNYYVKVQDYTHSQKIKVLINIPSIESAANIKVKGNMEATMTDIFQYFLCVLYWFFDNIN